MPARAPTDPFTFIFKNKHLVVTNGKTAEQVFREALARMQRLRVSASRNTVLCLSRAEIQAFARSRFVPHGHGHYISSMTFGLAYEMGMSAAVSRVQNANLIYGVDAARKVSHLQRLQGGARANVPRVDVYRRPDARFYIGSRLPDTSGMRVLNPVVRKRTLTAQHQDGRRLQHVAVVAATRRDGSAPRFTAYYTDMATVLWTRTGAYQVNGTLIW